ncbi:MAG: SusC/RagA family TonB-linked outer membrane protein [Prevotella sp.]|nr:SusC/RagA family TonB-linked outer membrane protein [Prevotella sp.]MDY4040226.1 SusC/RagA family TonB-linked outer membrane protein [Prevotella sp.]
MRDLRIVSVFALLLTLVLCLGAPLEANAQNERQQTVTMNMQSVTVKQFLANVRQQTGLNFIYSSELAKTFPRVTVVATRKPVRQVLDEVMAKIGCRYDIAGSTVTITRRLSGARTRMVTGVVTDDTGEPLPGVSICIDDSKVCTITDAEGFYTLKVPENPCTLRYTFVGMAEAQVPLNAGRQQIRRNVQMVSENNLDEVVVTGYQDISRPKMTGSAITITADKLDDRYTPNLLNNLEGRVAGLSTYGGDLKIRGTSSLYANTSPLLVVDGVPVEQRIDELNPYDIESINVLKDAAATAIYGARASNGIIVITTKNARKSGKIDIDFSANLTIQEKKNMDYADNFYMNAAQQVDTEAAYWNYYFFDNDGEVQDPISSTATGISNGSSYISPIQYGYYQLAQGKITQEQLNATLNKLRTKNYAKEYGDAVYRQQIMQQYNLAVRSRSDKAQSNLTMNYRHSNGELINSGTTYLNISYKGAFEITKWLTARATINGIYSRAKRAGTDYNASYTNPWAVPAYESLYNDDGSLRGINYWYDGNNYWTYDTDVFKNLQSNPLEELYRNTVTTKTQNMRYHGDLLFKIMPGLTAETQFIYETAHTTSDWIATEESHAARTIYNAYTYLDSTGKVAHYTPAAGGFRQTSNTDGAYWTARGQMNLDRTLGRHSINAIAGLEFRQTKTDGTRALALGYDDQLQNSGTATVDFATISTMRNSSYYMSESRGFPAQQFAYDPYIDGGLGIIPEVKHRYASGYFNATYTYDNKYNLFGSFRKDYADVYGLNAKFRGRPLWSVGAAWNVNEEAFMKPVKWVNYLKVRFSYGVTGNIYQGATSYMTATAGSLNAYTNLPYGEVESPANPNLKWEKTRTTNLGVDFSLLGNRLRGSLDYYFKKGEDIFSYRQLDPTTGFTSMFMNTASMKNNGVELQLTYDWLRSNSRQDLTWSTSFTMACNKNEITSVENPATLAYQLISTPYKVGYPSSALWSYRFAGISDVQGEKGQTLWYIEDNGKTHNAASRSISILEYSGQSEPKINMNMDNRLTWNGFSLSLMMAYYGGHVMRALAEDETFNVPTTAIPSYFINAWTPEHPTGTPGIGRYASTSLGSEPRYSDISVRKADFLKVRNIVFGYDLPQQWLTAIRANRVSLRFQIDNPKYLWVANKVNVDPETLGIRTPSSFIFGLNVNF